MRSLFRSVLLTSVLLGACSSGPKYKIDDALLADVPPSDKAQMLQIQSELNQASEEKNKAQSDAAIADKELSVAEAEYDKAKADVNMAKAERDLAESTKDLNKIASAKSNLEQKQLAKDVSDAKIDFAKARRSHTRALFDSAEQRIVALQARYEQSKAQLAAAKGKKPTADFSVSTFDEQAATA